MLCPNDSTEMHQVKIVGHYGGPIIIDQCEKCGGIWFDEAELFRAKQGEAEKIEMLDTEILQAPSPIENSTLFCPRSEAEMHRFTDRHLPQDIVLVRCPLCHGIWLNRGMLKESIAYWEALHESRRSPGTLKRLREFLTTDINSGFSFIPYLPDVDAIADFLATIIRKLLIPY